MDLSRVLAAPRRATVQCAASAGCAVLLAAGAAGCSGGSSSGGSGGAGRPTATAVPAASAAAARTLHARDYVINQGPATAGLVVDTSPDNDPDPDISLTQLAKCLGVSTADVSDQSTDSADGPALKSGDELTNVNSHAYIDTAAQVTSDAAVYRRAQLPGCFRQLIAPYLHKELQKLGGDGNIDQASFISAPAGGGTSEIRMAITLTTVAGEQVPYYFDMIFFTVGRVESTLSVSQVGQVPDSSLEQALATQTSQELANQ